MLRVHVKMLQRELIRAEVNVGEFLKSTLNVGDFTRNYKYSHYFISAADSRSIPRNWNWPEMWCKSFCTLTFHTVKSKERQSFVIPFHCRFKELIIFTIIYFFLYCPPCSVLHIFFLWNQPPKIIY